MRKIISFMHISLDGFVAGPNGEMNWIKVDQEVFSHIEKRISQTDTALYGRTTYQMMESYWPTAAEQPNASPHDIEHAKWYKSAHKLVLSNTLANESLNNTKMISGDFARKINEIKHQSGSEILLFGSPRATHAMMAAGLIDGYWLFVNPVILGKGISLFENVRDSIKLKLVSTNPFSIGVTELNYVLEKQ